VIAVDRAIVTTFVTIPAAALTTSATAQPCTSYYVSGGYDRFTGATKAFSHFAPVAGSTVASIGAIIAPGKRDAIALVLQTISSNGLRYNGCYASYILADGRPVATGWALLHCACSAAEPDCGNGNVAQAVNADNVVNYWNPGFSQRHLSAKLSRPSGYVYVSLHVANNLDGVPVAQLDVVETKPK
jgi:hypothetical protein